MKDRNIAKRKLYHRRRDEAIFFFGSRCQECGENDTNKLQFHHRDMTTKVMNMALMWANTSEKRIWNELDKCDLLCAKCHFNKFEDHNKKPAQHGTRSKYMKRCRCSSCSKASYEYNRIWYENQRI